MIKRILKVAVAGKAAEMLFAELRKGSYVLC